MKLLGKLFVVFVLVLPSLRAEELVPESHFGRIAEGTSKALPRNHMNHVPFSDAIARRGLENFLRAMDYDRTFFLASDIKQFRTRVDSLDDAVRSGDLGFAYDVFSLFKQRAANRVAFVLGLLDEGFDVEQNEKYVWNRKDAAWPMDEAEWDDLWRKKVKNEYIASLVSREMSKLDAEETEAKKAAAAAADTNAVEEASLEVTDTNAVAEVTQASEMDLEEKLSPENAIRKRYEQFLTILNGHDAEYVLQMYLNAFTQSYDTHSSYFSPRANEDFGIQMGLQLTGIGALLSYDEGSAKIVKLISGGPAERDGRLKPGDKIIAVAQGDEEAVDILYWPLYKSVRLIRGEKGSTVVLSVVPASDPSGSVVKKIDLVRDHIKLEDKAAKSKVYDLERDAQSHKLGIIHLPDFYLDMNGKRNDEPSARSCAADVRKLLGELNEAEVEGLVLDLRNNGGGSLSDCVEMTGFFIDRGPVVQVKAGRVQAMNDPKPGLVFDKPMVVLVNRQSASASEILAAALQDYGRAVIVGDSKTHGKGSVQSLMPIDRNDESMGALKMTTAAFYRVDGRSTQLKGVSPDIVIRTPTDVMELGEEYLDNVLDWSWVNPSAYRPYDVLNSRIKDLKILSENRLDENERFASYQKKIDRLAERVQRREVSLHLQERIAQAENDRELDKLYEKGMMLNGEDEHDEEADDEEKASSIRPEKDMVLKEGLEILTDLITNAKPPMEAAVVN